MIGVLARNECVTTSKNPATNIILFHVIQYEDDFYICLSFYSSSCNIQKCVSISKDHWECGWSKRISWLIQRTMKFIVPFIFRIRCIQMWNPSRNVKGQPSAESILIAANHEKKNNPCHDHHEFISATFGECPNTKPTMYLVRSIARSLHFGCFMWHSETYVKLFSKSKLRRLLQCCIWYHLQKPGKSPSKAIRSIACNQIHLIQTDSELQLISIYPLIGWGK